MAAAANSNQPNYSIWLGENNKLCLKESRLHPQVRNVLEKNDRETKGLRDALLRTVSKTLTSHHKHHTGYLLSV